MITDPRSDAATAAARQPGPPPSGLPNYTRVAALLRQEIIDGVLSPGTWLRMNVIAGRCRVSVQPVRDALQQLEGEGLVTFFPNRGAQVRGVDRQRLVHIHEIGEALEGFLAGQFAEEASRRDLRELETLQVAHDAAIDAQDWGGMVVANRAFHRHINARGGNEEAQSIVTRYYGLGEGLRARLGYDAAYCARVRQEHHALIEAFRRHDSAAALRVGAAHVRGILQDMLANLAS